MSLYQKTPIPAKKGKGKTEKAAENNVGTPGGLRRKERNSSSRLILTREFYFFVAFPVPAEVRMRSRRWGRVRKQLRGAADLRALWIRGLLTLIIVQTCTSLTGQDVGCKDNARL